MKEKAVYYFNNGYSCSESIIMAAIEEGLVPKELLACATSFSGGMSSGCLCGGISGAQLVVGYNFGRNNLKKNDNTARQKAMELVEEFKKRNKYTCCKALTMGVNPAQKKEHCSKMVSDGAEILESLLGVKV